MRNWSFYLIVILAATVSLGAQANSVRSKTPAVGGTKPAGAISAANLSGAVVAGVPSFTPRLDYGSGGYIANSVAVGDLNGDGKPDLVVANNCVTPTSCTVGNVGVLISNGDGTFRPVVSYALPSTPGTHVPVSVALVDVNHDNRLDILIAIRNSSLIPGGDLGVMLGNGDGTFRPMVTYPAGEGSPISLATGDLNGDGSLDVVVAQAGQSAGAGVDSVGVLLNNGDGTFQPGKDYPSGGYYPISAVIGDLRGKGVLDIAASNLCVSDLGCPPGSVGVLTNQGDGTFPVTGLHTFDPKGTFTSTVALADVNGDGFQDVLALNTGCTAATPSCTTSKGSVAVFLGNGSGGFSPAVTYLTDGSGYGLVVTDINADGKLDLVVAGSKTDILLGNGDGTFQPSVAITNGTSAEFVAVADMNGDGLPDLIFSSLFASNVSLPGGVQIAFNDSGAHTPTTTSLASNANPANPDQLITYTAKVTSSAAGPILGTVTFQEAGAPLATVELINQASATFTAKYSSVGTHSITAVYSGGPRASGSTSPTLTEQISIHSTTVLKTSLTPSFVGQSVTFTATIKPNIGTIPNGELVTFYDGGVVLGTGATVGGVATFTTSSLTAKTHTIKASYPGDSSIRGSSATIPQVVQLYATTTALVSSANPSKHGSPVTFTATVKGTGPSAPTGKVQFRDGTNVLGTAVTLTGNTAALTTSGLIVGTHSITAQYLGDSVSAKSTSATVNQVVQ